MRIATNDAVAVGDVLRVALHCGNDLEPLVLLATALRQDGQDGTCLAFKDLTGGQREHLEKIIESSSPIQAISGDPLEDDEDFGAGGIIIGEMLETVERGNDRQTDQDEACGLDVTEVLEADSDIDAHIDSVFDTHESV